MKKWLLIAAVAFALYRFLAPGEVELGPGVHAPDAPQQQTLARPPEITLPGYATTPLASFALKAKVLGKKHYRSGRESELAPYDLALGWGRMSDEAVLEHIDIRQSGRWYHWQTRELPIPAREISVSSANMHMIPASSSVKRALESVRPGEVIELEGFLVNLRAADGWRWQSSTTRNDTGDGACELVYVKSLRVVK